MKRRQGTDNSSITFSFVKSMLIAYIYFHISDKQTKMLPKVSSNTERKALFSVTAKYIEVLVTYCEDLERRWENTSCRFNA